MIKKIASYLFVLFLSIFAILPIFKNGFFPMHDDTQVARVFEMAKSLTDGLFPVRWVADLGYGYGYPIFNYYGPLPYYMGGFLNFIGADALIATKIMFVFAILFSGITMYIFSSRFFGRVGGVLSAIFYMYFPYHGVNIYVRGAVGEIYSYVFIPLVFLGLFKIYQITNEKKTNEKLSYILLTSFSIFLTLTSHTLTVIILAVILFLFLVISLIFSKQKLLFLKTFLISVISGGMLSSFFLIPAFFEMNYTNVSSQIGGGADYKDHFVCISQYWNSVWGYGGSIPGCLDGMSFALGKINIFLIILSIVLFVFFFGKKVYSRIQSEMFITCTSLLLITIFLQTELSQFFWNIFPFMEYIQYPWRFLNFTALFSSFIVGSLFINLKNSNYKILGAVAVMIIIVLLNSKYFVPQNIKNVNSQYYINEEKLHYQTSKISDEYLPKDFKKPQRPENLITLDYEFENGGVQVMEDSTRRFIVNYESLKDNNTFVLYRTFFPGWKAYVNGKEIETDKFDNSFIKVSLPEGKGELKFELKQTPVQILGNLITLSTFIFLFAVVILKSLRLKFYRFVQ